MARFLAGLVGVEEAGVGFAGRFEVVDGMIKSLDSPKASVHEVFGAVGRAGFEPAKA